MFVARVYANVLFVRFRSLIALGPLSTTTVPVSGAVSFCPNSLAASCSIMPACEAVCGACGAFCIGVVSLPCRADCVGTLPCRSAVPSPCFWRNAKGGDVSIQPKAQGLTFPAPCDTLFSIRRSSAVALGNRTPLEGSRRSPFTKQERESCFPPVFFVQEVLSG